MGDDHPVALGFLFLGNIHAEIDGAHDTVTELLVNEFLDGVSIDITALASSLVKSYHPDLKVARGKHAATGDQILPTGAVSLNSVFKG